MVDAWQNLSWEPFNWLQTTYYAWLANLIVPHTLPGPFDASLTRSGIQIHQIGKAVAGDALLSVPHFPVSLLYHAKRRKASSQLNGYTQFNIIATMGR